MKYRYTHIKTLLLTVSLLVNVMGCSRSIEIPIDKLGTDTGNAIVMSLSVKGVDQTGASGIDIDEAWVGLDNLIFYDCNDNSKAAFFDGPFAIDLSSETDLGNLETTSTALCRLDIELQVYNEVKKVEPISGHSLFLSGKNSNQIPFEVRSHQVSKFSPVLLPIELSEGSNDVILWFDPHIWMENIDIDSAEQVQDVVLIDDSHNTDSLNEIHDNIMQCGNMMSCENMMDCEEMMQCIKIDHHSHTSDEGDMLETHKHEQQTGEEDTSSKSSESLNNSNQQELDASLQDTSMSSDDHPSEEGSGK